jgi:hypothetical protein
MIPKFPQSVYNDATISAIESAFSEIVKTMAMHNPLRDIRADGELRDEIITSY